MNTRKEFGTMKKILVVDDAMFMRLSLKAMLGKNGFEVVGEADNGKKAIEMYQRLKPDIVTMDITMPEMEGIEAVEQIIQIDPKATIVMVSAMGQEDKIKRAIMKGARGFIVKPFNEDKLVKTMKQFS